MITTRRRTSATTRASRREGAQAIPARSRAARKSPRNPRRRRKIGERHGLTANLNTTGLQEVFWLVSDRPESQLGTESIREYADGVAPRQATRNDCGVRG